jgi:hypothetical protein
VLGPKHQARKTTNASHDSEPCLTDRGHDGGSVSTFAMSLTM